MSYLLKNDMEPTIRNLYLSNYSSSAENIVEPEQSGIDFESLMPQIREIIAEAGLSDDEHAVDNSKWLVANQIPLTPENLQYLTDLQRIIGRSADRSYRLEPDRGFHGEGNCGRKTSGRCFHDYCTQTDGGSTSGNDQ